MKKPALFSFFSGLGFLDLGFERSGFEVVLVNEKYPRFIEAYKHSRKKLGISKPLFGHFDNSIEDFLNDDQKLTYLKNCLVSLNEANRITGFVGGPPCPDFSVGGKNKGRSGDKGKLSGTYISLIKEVKPDFFLFENVKGLLKTKKHRKFYNELKENISDEYTLTDKLINAIEYGVPQNRERIILIGFNKNFLKRNKFKGKIDQKFLWNKYTEYQQEKVLNLEWSDKDPFIPNSDRPFPNSVPKELTVQYWFDRNNVEDHKNSNDHFIPRSARKSFEVIEEGDDSRKSSKRLHRWRYSPTAAYGNNEVHLHPYKIRRLSASEALAIQSLPKEFELPDELTLTDKFKGIGNGVPYLASKGLAESVLDFFKDLED